MGKGSWWGHGRERAFSWVWLNHRRGSSGLRDKNLATPVEIWTATTGRSVAFQRSLPSKAAEALAGVFGVGVTGGARGVQLSPSLVVPWPALCQVGSGQAFLPRGRNEKRRLGANAQLSKRTHGARVGRVSTGLGSTVLSDAC